MDCREFRWHCITGSF